MTEPLVSVIIPAYNCQDYIVEAVESVLEQDYKAKEIIVVDDGSKDATVQQLAPYEGQVNVIEKTNGGPASARNRGLHEAHGDFVAFLDGDDLWCPGKLAMQMDYISRRPEVGLVFNAWQVWRPDAQGRFLRDAVQCQQASDVDALVDPALTGWIYPELLLECRVHTITALVRAAVVAEVGFFDESLPVGEDYDFWLRISRMAEIHKLKPVKAVYRQHGGNTTAKPKNRNYEYDVIKRAVDKWGLAGPDGRKLPLADYHRRLLELSFTYGYDHFWYGSAKCAQQGFQRCLSHDARHTKARMYMWLSRIKRLWQALTGRGRIS